MTKVILIIIFSFIFISCAKDIKKGTPITVSGFVLDTVKNKALPFVKIYLVGGKVRGSNGMTYYYNYVDSTNSDMNGNFSIDYKAEGSSVDYVLEVANDNNYGTNTYQQFYFSNNSKNVRLKTQELNFLKLNLKIEHNPYDTFYIYPSQGTYKRLLGGTIDTTVLIKVLPNNSNLISYRIMSVGNDSGAVYRKIVDTVFCDIRDTTNLSKTISSTYQMPF
jgi:hypothetical protein